MRGALATVDRSYGWLLNTLHHHIQGQWSGHCSPALPCPALIACLHCPPASSLVIGFAPALPRTGTGFPERARGTTPAWRTTCSPPCPTPPTRWPGSPPHPPL